VDKVIRDVFHQIHKSKDLQSKDLQSKDFQSKDFQSKDQIEIYIF